MRIKTTRLEIPDVVLIEHEAFEDERGYFMEAYNRAEFRAHGLPDVFVQLNESRSGKNVVRGLHFQWDPPMGKLMRVVEGAAFLVAVDVRHDSPTVGKWVAQAFSADDKKQLWAPAGFARGVCTLREGTRVQYLCTGSYNGSAEGGIRWNDPAVGIPWPVAEPLVSAKDRNAPTLREWLARPESKNFSV